MTDLDKLQQMGRVVEASREYELRATSPSCTNPGNRWGVTFTEYADAALAERIQSELELGREVERLTKHNAELIDANRHYLAVVAERDALAAQVEALKNCGNCDRDPQACDECDECTWDNSQWTDRKQDR